MIKSFRRAVVFLAVALGLMVVFGQTRTASAANNEVPDRATITDPVGSASGNPGSPPNGGVLLEISQPSTDGSGAINLNVEEAWVKLYFNTSQTNFSIHFNDPQFKDCAVNSFDTQGDNASCPDNGAVKYNIYYPGAPDGSSPGALCDSINSDHPLFMANTEGGWVYLSGTPCNPGATAPVNTGTTSLNYVLFVQAVWNTSEPQGRINAFKVATGNGIASYWGYPGISTSSGQPGAGQSGYAIQDRYWEPDTEVDMWFHFAPNCSITAPTQVYLKWQDADNANAPGGGVPQDGAEFGGDNPIFFQLIESNPDGSGATTLANINESSSPNIGGNNAYRELAFTANPGKHYRWYWLGVNRQNGIQMWIPFDSFYVTQPCAGTTGGGDHGVEGRVFNDIDGDGLFNGADQIIKVPGSSCSAAHTVLDLTVSADGSTGRPGSNPAPPSCNGPFGAPMAGPGDYAFYKIKTNATGNVEVRINVPPGWQVTAKGPTRTYNVPANGYVGPTDINDYFGIREVRQGVQGRVFIDDNNNGLFDGADKIIKNPSGACSGPNVYVPGTTVTATTAPGNPTSDLSVCNGPFASPPQMTGPGTYSLYQVQTPSGSQTVRVNLPTDWIANSKGTTRTYNVPVNGWGGPTTENDYFGILPRKPDLTPICVNSNSLARISWPTAGLSVSEYYVDISTSSNFSSYSNKRIGASDPRTINDAPAGFSGSLNTKLVEGTTYYARIYYAGPNIHSEVFQFTSDRCPRLTCGPLQPIEAESNEPVNMRVSFNNIGLGGLASGANLGVSFAGYSNPNIDYSAAPSARPLPAGQTATSNPGAIPFNKPAGTYTINWTVTGDSRSNQLNNPPTECSGTITVSDKPYFRAYGGDVVVGINPLGSCPGWPGEANATIRAFAKNDGRGAGAQLAAYTLGSISIEDFVTTTGRTGPPPGSPPGTGLFPKGLTFANTGAGYGSNSELPWCPPDYFNSSSRPASPSSAFLQALVTPLFGVASGNYYYDATQPPPSPLSGLYQFTLNNNVFKGTCLPLLPCNNLGSDERITIYAKGDVVIDGNITFDTNGWSVGNVPSLYVIVQGNIYIQPGVTQIDGVYIAQDDGSGSKGKIFTCANGAAPPPNEAWMISNCRDPARKLTINGTLIAQRLRLLRINGTRFAGSSQEVSNSTNIAEMVNSGPETWLTVPAPFPPSTIGNYDAATSLPPTL